MFVRGFKRGIMRATCDAFSILVFLVAISITLDQSSAGWCNQRVSKSVTKYKTSYTSCGWWGWWRCQRTRRYTTTEYETKRVCCPGYSGGNCDTRTVGEPSNNCIDVSRSEWMARSPKQSPSSVGSPRRYFIHHSAGSRCYSQSSCSSIVRGIQTYHMSTNGWSDIGYNFLIGDDGKVYEGRGWAAQGAHSYGYNYNSIGICVLGTYSNSAPSSKAQDALKRLMACGVTKGYMSSAYDLHGHRDVKCTECPGQAFYNLLTTWPRFKGCLESCTSKCGHCCKRV